ETTTVRPLSRVRVCTGMRQRSPPDWANTGAGGTASSATSRARPWTGFFMGRDSIVTSPLHGADDGLREGRGGRALRVAQSLLPATQGIERNRHPVQTRQLREQLRTHLLYELLVFRRVD